MFYQIEKIIVPISIRFKKINYSNFDVNGINLAQYSLLTANLLENFEINNCAMVKYSYEMYTEIILNDKQIYVFNHQLMTYDIIDFDINI